MISDLLFNNANLRIIHRITPPPLWGRLGGGFFISSHDKRIAQPISSRRL